MTQELLNKFKSELENYLDVYFPKAENTDVRKSPNNRSAALVLYAEAVILFEKYLKELELNKTK